MLVLDKNAKKKEHLFQNSIPKYIFRAILAGMYLTIGTAVAVTVGEKGNHIHPDLGKFFYAFTFSLSLVMIIYMDTELGTSNMMYLTTGVSRNVVRVRRALQILFVCVFFNFIGGTIFSLMIAQTSTFAELTSDHFLFTTVQAKLGKSAGQIVMEGIFANVIVNTAIISSARMKDDAGKFFAIMFIIFIFAFLGFEHVIANFSSFSMAFFINGGAMEGMTVGSVLQNYALALIGNYIGGGLLIGLGYSWLNRGETVYYD
ncbi:formate/nitrite transporter family protein [Jeotgalibaca caeni]|uniref:formate/nitrite transporter family protein n=1 Tax=Jeotgalibaca caeni TaxID=3028623 RepID=UPI00237E4BA4|nr:formate/nitrite transporter family protein [Jeotgalibaca caeni]MDE1548396.1 formate/nitrite transporter family protein [Jeotgalibaca caeni]